MATVEERTVGWAVALVVDRNMRATGADPPGVDAVGLSENYVGVRLLRRLSTQDRAFLFDLAVFDRIDADPLLPAGGTTERVGERARVISGAWHLLRCISCCHRAEFEESRRHGVQARARFANGMRYGDVVASIYLGIVDMMQGRVQDAIE